MRFLLVHFLRVGAHAQAGSGAAANAALPLITLARRNLAIVTAGDGLVLSGAMLAVVEVGGELNALIHRLFQRIRRDRARIV